MDVVGMLRVMASLTRYPDCKYWFACYRDASRRQRRTSTHETNRKKALEIAAKLEAIAQHRLPHRGLVEVLAGAIKEHYGMVVPMATMAEFVADWLKMKEPEVSANTLLAYRITMERFLAFLGKSAECNLLAFTKQHLVEFRKHLSETNAPGTVNKHMERVKMLFHVAKRDGYIIDDPSEFVDQVRNVDRRARDAFTIPELQAVLSVADPEWRSIILFGLYSGQRLGDVATLTWDHIDLEDDVIRLVDAKTRKTMTIPIAPPLRAHIDSMPTSDVPGAPLHPRAFKKYDTRGLSDDFAKILARAGLREPKIYKPTGKGRTGTRQTFHKLTFHSLRHTAVSMLKDAGVPQATVMELVGHSSKAMSQHYTHVGLESLRRAAAAFPNL